jgi:hypothetical protein
MTSQIGPRIPQAALEDRAQVLEDRAQVLEVRVRVLEDRMSTIAEAIRILARGLEGSPTAEPGEKPVAESARRANELLLAEAHPAAGRGGSTTGGTP